MSGTHLLLGSATNPGAFALRRHSCPLTTLGMTAYADTLAGDGPPWGLGGPFAFRGGRPARQRAGGAATISMANLERCVQHSGAETVGPAGSCSRLSDPFSRLRRRLNGSRTRAKAEQASFTRGRRPIEALSGSHSRGLEARAAGRGAAAPIRGYDQSPQSSVLNH
jgi:hypothetical protein